MPFKSKAQQRLFYAKAKTDGKFKKMAEEFAAVTDFAKLPQHLSEGGPVDKSVAFEPGPVIQDPDEDIVSIPTAHPAVPSSPPTTISGTSLLISPSGGLMEVPTSTVAGRLTQGYQPASPEQLKDVELQKKYGSLGSSVKAGLMGAGEGLGTEATTAALTKLGIMKPETAKGLEEANPMAHGAGFIAGLLAQLYLTKGEGGGDLVTPAGLISKLGRSVEGEVLSGMGPSTTLGERVLARAASTAAGSAVEAEFWGAGHIIKEQALGDPNYVGQSVFADAGLNALLGAGIGFTGGLAAEGLPVALEKAMSIAGKPAQAARDWFVDKYPAIASRLIGASEDDVKFLIDNRQYLGVDPAGKKAAEEFLINRLNDVEETSGILGKEFYKKGGILQQDLSIAAERVDPIVANTESQRLVEEAKSALASARSNASQYELSQLNNLGKMIDHANAEVMPNTDQAIVALNGIAKKMAHDPTLMDYPKIPAISTLRRVSEFVETLPKLPTTGMSSAAAELADIASQAPRSYAAELANVAKSLEPFQRTPMQLIETLQVLKKNLDDFVPYGQAKYMWTEQQKNMTKLAMGLRTDIAKSLHNPDMFGDAAARLSAVDSAQHKLMQSREALLKGGSKIFRKEYGLSTGPTATWEVDPAKVRTWFREINSAQGAARLEDLKDYLESAKGFAQEFKNSYSLNKMSSVDPNALDSLINKTGEATEQLRTRAAAQQMARELAPKEQGLGIMGGVAETAMGSLLGPAGVALGAAHTVYKAAKHVPAAVATLATLERVAAETTRGISAAARAVVTAGTRVGLVGRGAAVASLSPVFKSDSATLQKSYAKRVEQVRTLAASPLKLQESCQNQTQAWSSNAPQTAQALQTTMVRAVNYLNNTAPKSIQVGPLAPKIEPNSIEIAAWMRRWEAVNSPLVLLKQLSARTVTSESIDAVQNVHPAMFQSMLTAVDEAVKNAKEPVPYQTRLMIAMLHGSDIDGTLQPQSAGAIQALYAQTSAPSAPQQGGKKGSKKPAVSKMTVAERTKTTTQKLEEGES